MIRQKIAKLTVLLSLLATAVCTVHGQDAPKKPGGQTVQMPHPDQRTVGQPASTGSTDVPSSDGQSTSSGTDRCPPGDPAVPCTQSAIEICDADDDVDACGTSTPLTDRDDFYMGAGFSISVNQKEDDGEDTLGDNQAGSPSTEVGSNAGGFLDVLALLNSGNINELDSQLSLTRHIWAQWNNATTLIENSFITYGTTLAPRNGSTPKMGSRFNWSSAGARNGTPYNTYTSDRSSLIIRRYLPSGDNPYVELFYPSGKVVRMGLYFSEYTNSGNYVGFENFRAEKEWDPFDNETTYTYSSFDGRIIRVEDPATITEYDWHDSQYAENKMSYGTTPATPWAGGDELHNKWLTPARTDQYTTIAITQHVKTPAGLKGARINQTVMLFDRGTAVGYKWNIPLRGAKLFRIYSWVHDHLARSPSESYEAASPLQNQWKVVEITYHGQGSTTGLPGMILGKKFGVTSMDVDGINPAASLVFDQDVEYEYNSLRKTTAVRDRLNGRTQYNYLPGGEIEQTHLPTGLKTVTTYDGQMRITREEKVAAWVPWDSDIEGNRYYTANALQQVAYGWVSGSGESEPLVWLYEYALSCGCNQPTKITYPDGSVAEFVYDNATGYVLVESRPNPETNAAHPNVITTYTYELLGDGSTQSAYALSQVKKATGTGIYGSNTIWQKDIVNTYIPRTSGTFGALYGNKLSSSTSTLATGYGQEVVTERRAHNANGTLASETSGDGVKTTYTYVPDYPFRVQSTLVAGEVVVGTETIRKSFVYNTWGLPSAITHNVGAATQYVENISYTSMDPEATDQAGPVSRREKVGSGVSIVTEIQYDQWGNIAIRERNNESSTGTTPSLDGTSGSNARGMVRNEWHYDPEGRLIRMLRDRRPLDEGMSGPLVSDLNARMLETRYSYVPSTDLVATETLPNGAVRTYEFDGFNNLYRTRVETDAPAPNGVYTGLGPVFVSHQQYTEETYIYDANKRIVASASGDPSEAFSTSSSKHEATVYEHNDAGVVTSVTYPSSDSGVIAPTFTDSVLPPSEQVSDWKPKVTYELDALGRVSKESVNDVNSGQLLRERSYERDALGRVRRMTEDAFLNGVSSAAREELFDYQGVSKLINHELVGARRTVFAYDSLARLKASQDYSATQSQVTRTYTYQDRSGYRTREQTEEQRALASGGFVSDTYVTEIDRDAFGRVLAVRELGSGQAGGDVATTSYTWFSTGGLESVTDPNGLTTRYMRDPLDRETAAREGSGSNPSIRTTVYDDWTGLNDRSKVTQSDPRGLLTVTHYDFAGRAVAIQSPGSNLAFDPMASPLDGSLGVFDLNFPGPNTRFFEYDGFGNVSTVSRGNGLQSWAMPDRFGRSIGVWRLQSATGETSDLSVLELVKRDGLGRVVELVQATGDNARVSSPALGVQSRVRLDVDSLGRTLEEEYSFRDVANVRRISSQWGSNPEFKSILDLSDGFRVGTMPDSVGRLSLLSIDAGSGPEALAAYGFSGGRVSSRVVAHSSTVFGVKGVEFDNLGRVSRITEAIGTNPLVSKVYDYDPLGLLQQAIYAKQNGTDGDYFVFDGLHRLSEANIGASLSTDSSGAPIAGQLDPSTYTQRYQYTLDASHNRTQVDSTPWGGATASEVYTPETDSNEYDSVGSGLSGVDYSYDSRGNLIFDGVHFFVYDQRDRLSEVYDVTFESSESQQSASLLSTTPSVSANAGLSSVPVEQLSRARAEIVANTSGDLWATGKERALQIESGAISARVASSSAGSFPSLSGVTSSSLIALEDPGIVLTLKATYIYDGSNRRLGKNVVGVGVSYFGYDGWREVEEYGLRVVGAALEAHPIRQFVWGAGLDELVMCRQDESFFGSLPSWVRRFAYQGIGDSVSRYVDAFGSDYQIYEYDAYGGTTSYGVVGGAFRFQGKRFDPETGLYFFRNRYYSPVLGRFLSTDSMGDFYDSVNRGNGYGFVGDRGYALVDPLGLTSQDPGKKSDDFGGLLSSTPAGHIDIIIPDGSIYYPDLSWDAMHRMQHDMYNPGLYETDGNGVDVLISLGMGVAGFWPGPGSVIAGYQASVDFEAGRYGWAAFSVFCVALPFLNGLRMVGRTARVPRGVRKVGGRYPINSRYAGGTHASGVRFTAEGFPDFFPHAKARVEMGGLTGNYAHDAAMANRAAGFGGTPSGMVWHHVEDGRTMLLVPQEIHSAVRHTGGAAVIRHGGN